MTPDPRGNDSVVGTDADAGPDRRGPTRRQVISIAGGTVAAAGLALGPFSSMFAGAAEGDVPPEVALTSWLMGLELAAVAVYEPLATDGAFDAATQDLVTTCASHHGAHGASLSEMVSAAGGDAPTDPTQTFVDDFSGRIAAAADGAAKATILAEMEDGFAATYQAALTTITSAPLAAIAAKVLATDATHAVAWAAAANGQDSEAPLPPAAALPASQSEEGAFTETTFTANTTTTAAPETTTAAGDDATSTTTGDAS